MTSNRELDDQIENQNNENVEILNENLSQTASDVATTARTSAATKKALEMFEELLPANRTESFNSTLSDDYSLKRISSITSLQKNCEKSKKDPNQIYKCCNWFRDLFCNFIIELIIFLLTIFVVRRKRLTLVLTLFMTIFIVWSMPYLAPNKYVEVRNTSHLANSRGYLVDTEFCKIQDVNPYSDDIIKYFYRQKFKKCTNKNPLTKIQYNETLQNYMLILNSKLSVACSYRTIERPLKGKHIGNNVVLGKRVDFDRTIALPSVVEYIYVICKNNNEIYKNVHLMIPKKPEIKKRFSDWNEQTGKNRSISVLLYGIDSISRVHLIRAMPRTAQYFYDNAWFEMAGYNKIEDNTFPNIMAILTGWNLTTIYEKCKPDQFGELDKCPYIWKTFRKYGYVTAFGEECESSMFHYAKQGFNMQPTDYYLRTGLLQTRSLPIVKKSKWDFCIGFKHSADYLSEYVFELVTRHQNDPFFGLFWTSSYSHEDISDASFMDEKVLQNLRQLESTGILDRTVVIFFSDHGLRFGPTRKYAHSHLEERLPFFFISIPTWMQNKYPEITKALVINKNRLTNPYDIHMTLKHILELTGRTSIKLPNADDCPNCQTIFRPMPLNRSCEDIAIDEHWCTCIPFKAIESNLTRKLANYALDVINESLMKYRKKNGEPMCAFRTLKRIIRVEKATDIKLNLYQIVFYANPSMAQLESTIKYDPNTNSFQLIGIISRLDAYGAQSNCIHDEHARLYCYCNR